MCSQKSGSLSVSHESTPKSMFDSLFFVTSFSFSVRVNPVEKYIERIRKFHTDSGETICGEGKLLPHDVTCGLTLKTPVCYVSSVT